MPRPHPQFPRLDPERGMGGGDDDAAACEMVAHHAGEQVLPGGIERRGRLVQQPDRPAHHEQAGDRKPPPLAGREIRRRQMRGMAEPHGGRGIGRCRQPRRRENPARTTGFPQRSAPASAHRDGRDSGIVPAGSARPRRPPGRPIRPPAPGGPRSGAAARSCRSRSGRPRPAASPDEASKSRPENTLAAAPDTVDLAPREPHFASSQPSEIDGYRVRICGYRIAAARLSVWRRF